MFLSFRTPFDTVFDTEISEACGSDSRNAGVRRKLITRLLDIVHSDAKLYLVFEFLDLDLKRYMDSIGDKDGLGPPIVRVSPLHWSRLVR